MIQTIQARMGMQDANWGNGWDQPRASEKAFATTFLKSNGWFIARSTVQPITTDDYIKYPELHEEMQEFSTPRSRKRLAILTIC